MGLFGFGKKVEDQLKEDISEVLLTRMEDIMSKYVISIQTHDKLRNAAEIIVGEKVSAVVVKDADIPIGVVTERDFLKKAPVDKKKLDAMHVNHLMSPKLITIEHDKTVNDAIPLLVKNNFRKLVVEQNGQMVGIVTQTDFVRLFNKFYDKLNVKTKDLLNVSDVMSKKVISTSRTDTFVSAKETMAKANIGSIAVVEKGELVGIITEYDVVSEIVTDPERANKATVEDIMVSPVMVIKENVNIFEANRLMVTDNVRRLPITDEETLKGIVTQTDMCRSIFFFLKSALWHIQKQDLQYEKLEKRVIEKRLV